MNKRIEAIATECMNSNSPSVTDWHRVAGNAALTAASENVAMSDRLAYRHAEAEALLKAVRAHDPNLTTAERLAVAACIAERA